MSGMIPFLQFRDFPSGLQLKIEETALRVIGSMQYILGQELQIFEKQFGEYLANDVQVAGVGNGFDALVIALKALGIGEGDEVIIPSNSYMATLNAVLQVGAKPVFSEPVIHTYNITASNVEKLINSKTKALMPVHLYGQACEMESLMKLADNYNLKVVEDAAQAHGAEYKGKHVGTFGNASAFSFYPSKNLGALGDGGALVSSNSEVMHFVKMYRNYGQGQKYVGDIIGVNSRLDELQAAILRVKLQFLNDMNAERQRLADIYLDELDGLNEIILPVTAPDCTHVYHIFNIRTKQRDRLQKWLYENNIATAIHYPVPVHLQPAYKFLGYKTGSYPIAEVLANTSLSLPLFPGLQSCEQEKIIYTIKKFFLRL